MEMATCESKRLGGEFVGVLGRHVPLNRGS